MVISTFLSAPIMYVSAWLLTIPLMDPTPLMAELENVSFNSSVISLVALVLYPFFSRMSVKHEQRMRTFICVALRFGPSAWCCSAGSSADSLTSLSWTCSWLRWVCVCWRDAACWRLPQLCALCSAVLGLHRYDPVELLGETRRRPSGQNSHLHLVVRLSVQHIHLDRYAEVCESCSSLPVVFFYLCFFVSGLIPLCMALTNRDDLLRLRPGVFMVLGWGYVSTLQPQQNKTMIIFLNLCCINHFCSNSVLCFCRIPFLMVGILLVLGERTNTIDSAFFYGRAQVGTNS